MREDAASSGNSRGNASRSIHIRLSENQHESTVNSKRERETEKERERERERARSRQVIAIIAVDVFRKVSPLILITVVPRPHVNGLR